LPRTILTSTLGEREDRPVKNTNRAQRVTRKEARAILGPEEQLARAEAVRFFADRTKRFFDCVNRSIQSSNGYVVGATNVRDQLVFVRRSHVSG